MYGTSAVTKTPRACDKVVANKHAFGTRHAAQILNTFIPASDTPPGTKFHNASTAPATHSWYKIPHSYHATCHTLMVQNSTLLPLHLPHTHGTKFHTAATAPATHSWYKNKTQLPLHLSHHLSLPPVCFQIALLIVFIFTSLPGPAL
jgi:hypothetical protein